jgi:UDP-glucose 4-epimerase
MVLKLANKKKKKVLIASTSEVYGKSTDVPFHEDADLVMGATTKGRWSYAAARPSTSSSPSPIGRRRSSPSSSSGSSTPSARGRPDGTAW